MTKKKIALLIRKAYAENINNPSLQIKALKKLLKQAQECEDLYFIGYVYHMLAVVYNMIGDNEGVFTNAVKSLTAFQNTSDHIQLANAYTTLGVAYFDQENFQLALANYDKAYGIIKKHRIKGPSRLIVMNNLATVYNVMGDYKSGILYLTESLEQARKDTPDNYDQLVVYALNLADSYIHDGDNEKALQILTDTESWADKVTFKPYICSYRLKYAIAGYNLNNKRTGNKNTDISIKLAKESADAYSVYDDFRELAHILVKNGDLKRAGSVIELVAEYGQRNKRAMDQLLVCSTLADYYKAAGDSDRAIEYYEQLEDLYKTRTNELKRIQLNIHKSMKDADSSITRLNRIIAENEERVNREPMTKLLNRSAMLKVSQEFIEAASKKKEKIGAIFIDIDYFKECNDTYGHAKGDEIIREVAHACQKEETDNIRFARYGGDEFLGLTRGLKDEAVTDIARRICDRIRKADIPNEKNPNSHRVTLSVGVVNVSITEKTDTIIQIVNYADKAVYYAKNAGKNCIYLLDHGRTNAEGDDEPVVKIDF